MDQDRKSRALKTLQGSIWEEGYAQGTLRGEVYPDVPAALERWTATGARVGIFSSGSVLAQTLLFRYSTAGDLTPLLRWHFDTSVGPKVDPASYGRIAGAVGVAPAAILFVSDTEKELDAARTAGLETRLCVRPPAQPPNRFEPRGCDDLRRPGALSPSVRRVASWRSICSRTRASTLRCVDMAIKVALARD